MIRTIYDKTDPQKAAAYLHDLLGDIVLSIVAEPCFENVAHLCPAMSETRTIIGLKDFPFAVGVDWDGSLNRGGYGFFDVRRENRSPLDTFFLKIGKSPKLIRALGYNNVKRELLDGYLPVVTTRTEYESIGYAHTVFAHSTNMSSSKDMNVLLMFSITNNGRQTQQFRIEICADPNNPRSIKTISGRITRNHTTHLYFKLRYQNSSWARPENEIGEINNIRIKLFSSNAHEYNLALEECRRFWKALLHKGTGITTTENTVNNGYKAWQIYNFLNVRRIKKGNKIYNVPHGGSGFYASVYGKESTAYIHALLLTGYFKEARTYLDGLLTYQEKNGFFSQITGMADNGALLFALSEYFILSNDYKSFVRYLPAMKKLAEWIIKNRNLKPHCKGAITYGLLPAGRISADMTDKDHTYRANVFNWKGMDDLSCAFSAAHMKTQAKYVKQIADSYRRDIHASMTRASFPETELFGPGDYLSSTAWLNRQVYQQGSLTVVPMTPVNRRLEKLFGGGVYYAIEACQILETNFFDPNDLLGKQIVEFMEKRGGILLGLVRWHNYAGLDHAYTYGYLLNKMRRDEINKVLLGFYSMFAYGMSRDTFSAAECVSLITQGKGVYGSGQYGEGVLEGSTHHCQPHIHSNTQQIRLLRMMVMREEGDNLLLAFTVPRPWLKHLCVSDAPTKWGKVSYLIACKGDRAEATVAFCPTRVILPKAILLRIRHPEKKRMESVKIDGKEWNRFDSDKEVITLPDGFQTLKVSISYVGG